MAIKFAPLVATALLFATIGEYASGAESRLVFHGSQKNISFCEGDDMEMSIEDGKLRISCADRRKTEVTISNGPVSLGNMILDCSGWCDAEIAADKDGVVTIDGVTFGEAKSAIVSRRGGNAETDSCAVWEGGFCSDVTISSGKCVATMAASAYLGDHCPANSKARP